MTQKISREMVEDFLFAEAALLDAWSLEAWIALFTDDGEYQIPATDQPDGTPTETLYLVYDDRHRLAERARRLLKRTAHVEFPHSRTCRIVSNVRILEHRADGVRATCNFVAYRTKNERTDIFPGHAEYDLVRSNGGGFSIRKKRAVVDTETLRGQGKLSILL